MNSSLTRCIQRSVLTVAVGVMSSHALAGEQLDPAPPAITVRFGDLNVSTADGVRALYARVRGAASAVCHSSPEWYPTEWWAYKDCYRATTDSVVARLNIPKLTALHLETTHREGAANTALQAGNPPIGHR